MASQRGDGVGESVGPHPGLHRDVPLLGGCGGQGVAAVVEGRHPDDFVFTSRTGLPLHNGDFYTHVRGKLMKALAAEGIAPSRFHDPRHTHVAWLVAGGAPLPHIQTRLGHESISTTIDTYGHLLPAGDELISSIIDTALSGKTIRPARVTER